MYTIEIHHKGDPSPTTYTIFKEEEAQENTDIKEDTEATNS